MNAQSLWNTRNILIAAALIVVAGITIAFTLGGEEADLTVPIDFEIVDIDSLSSGALSARPYVAPVNIDGTNFRLASFNNVEIPRGQNYTLSFDGNLLSAKFCNTMGGDFLLENGVIRTNPISTLMFCAEPANLMQLESAFAKVLSEGASFYVEGSTLTIRGSNGEKFFFEVFMD